MVKHAMFIPSLLTKLQTQTFRTIIRATNSEFETEDRKAFCAPFDLMYNLWLYKSGILPLPLTYENFSSRTRPCLAFLVIIPDPIRAVTWLIRGGHTLVLLACPPLSLTRMDGVTNYRDDSEAGEKGRKDWTEWEKITLWESLAKRTISSLFLHNL